MAKVIKGPDPEDVAFWNSVAQFDKGPVGDEVRRRMSAEREERLAAEKNEKIKKSDGQ